MTSRSSGHSYGALDPRPSGRTNPFDTIMSDSHSNNSTGNRFSDIKDSISGDIITINSSASSLDKSLKLIGTAKDTQQLREKIHESELTTNRIIKRTTISLQRLSGMCSRTDRIERLQCERLTGDFKEAVQRYNGMQKRVADKVKAAGVIKQERAQSDLIAWDDSAEPQQSQQQQQQQEQQLVADEGELELLREREEQIRLLEGDILDMNDIFRQLGTLVHEQGEVIDTIEDNVESAHTNVEMGNEQLAKASVYQSRARKKKLCLIAIIFVVIVILAIIIYFAVKH